MSRAGFAGRIGALVALGLLAYAGEGPNGFIYDDKPAVMENAVINGRRPLIQAFTHDFWGLSPARTVGTYRPIADLSLGLDWRIGKGEPRALRAMSILWHLLVVLATFCVWRGLVGEWRAFAAAAGVAVLAAPSEAVLTDTGRADVLCALWALVGLWAHRRPGWRAAVLATLCFGLALGSKETGVMAPVVWLALDWLLPGTAPRWPRLLAYAIPAAPYLCGRRIALGALYAPWTSSPVFNPLLMAGTLGRVFGAARVFLGHYVAGIVDPWYRLYDCSWHACGPAGPDDPLAWAGLLLAAGLAALPLLLRRRSPAAAAGLAWAGLFFLPASNFLVQGPTIYGERLLYTPAVGLCVAFVVGVDALANSIARPALVWGLGLVVLGVNVAAVRDRQVAWNDWHALLASGLQSAPDSAIVQQDLAVEAILRQDYPAAERAARRSIALYSHREAPHRDLASALFAMGRLDEAGPEFERAYALGEDATLVNDYANYLGKRGDLARAQKVLDDFLRDHEQTPELAALRAKLQRARAKEHR